MKTASKINVIILLLLIILFFPIFLYSQNVVVVIIDGARYSETFGDPNRTYIPKMDSLSTYATYIDEFYNDSMTYTSRALPALWTGTWTEVQDTFYNGSWTQFTHKPSVFEYYRKQKAAPENQCYYILKYVSSLWLPSFHVNYGPNYWPSFHSTGSTDADVLNEALQILNADHPQHAWIYFADVDSKGHSGVWNNYTRAIQIADSTVDVIWKFIQNDPVYQNNTYLFVTNDHGRHDDAHGGFQGHGDGCDGCRHIMFLALGPAVKQNVVSTTYRRIPDLSVTVAHLLNVNPEFATGNYMTELFQPTAVLHESSTQDEDNVIVINNYPNPFNSETTIQFHLLKATQLRLTIYSFSGKRVKTLINGYMQAGEYKTVFNGTDLSSGVYICQFQTSTYQHYQKLILLQ